MALSGRQSLAQTQFANSQGWWNRLRPTASFGVAEKDVDEDAASDGRYARRLPSLSETENDESYFDS